jgi:hypothetical protein
VNFLARLQLRWIGAGADGFACLGAPEAHNPNGQGRNLRYLCEFGKNAGVNLL